MNPSMSNSYIIPTQKIQAQRTAKKMGSVVDLFCGVGGLTYGFLLEGFNIRAGIDIDEDCRYPFEHNSKAPFICKDAKQLRGADISPLFLADTPKILVGCAPCQPFSSYNQKNNDPKWQLLEKFGSLIDEVLPDVVSMENVPRLLTFRGGTVLNDFINRLKKQGYKVSSKIVFAPDYGVPQQRSRLVVLASRFGPIRLQEPTHQPAKYATVKDAIGDLPSLSAGEVDSNDPLHRAAGLSAKNLKRIRAALPGGTWKDWNPELITDCHKAETGHGYVSVYGRMTWESPSPTITTQFYGFGNGRFGHPEQDRAISLREGAILQSFPHNYEFVAPGQKIHFNKIGKLIGNAVPVLLAQAIARSIKSHLEEVL